MVRVLVERIHFEWNALKPLGVIGQTCIVLMILAAVLCMTWAWYELTQVSLSSNSRVKPSLVLEMSSGSSSFVTKQQRITEQMGMFVFSSDMVLYRYYNAILIF